MKPKNTEQILITNEINLRDNNFILKKVYGTFYLVNTGSLSKLEFLSLCYSLKSTEKQCGTVDNFHNYSK